MFARLRTIDRPLWSLRLLWLALPALLSPGLDDALTRRSAAVMQVTNLGTSALWLVALTVMFTPRTLSLTVVRIIVPASSPVAVAIALASPSTTFLGVALIVVALVVSALAISAQVADSFVDGSSYGSERRFVLATPPAVRVLAVTTWSITSALALGAPLLVAAGNLRWGIPTLIVALGATVLVGRAIHSLSRRWLVFVPSGVVIHDPMARPESVMAPRPWVTRIAPYKTESGTDLRLGATGTALILETSEPLPVTMRTTSELTTVESTAVIFCPARPGAVLDAAENLRLPVG